MRCRACVESWGSSNSSSETEMDGSFEDLGGTGDGGSGL